MRELWGASGRGLFGVELVIRGDEAIFSALSPQPHDTGLVTLACQELSQLALHPRAVLGLPIPVISTRGPAASCAVLVEGDVTAPTSAGLDAAPAVPGTQLRILGKPAVAGRRRMAVTLAVADDVEGRPQRRARGRPAAHDRLIRGRRTGGSARSTLRE